LTVTYHGCPASRTPVARSVVLDQIMESFEFLPFRPGVPPGGSDIEAVFSRWEYAGNQRLAALSGLLTR
jgi:hypothetical protein